MPKNIDRYQVSLKVAIVADGKLLALKKDKGSFVGHYDLPGGRIDTDEFEKPFKEIVARELREELGEISYELSPRPMGLGRHRIHPDGDTPEIHVLYVLYEAQWLGGDMNVVTDEHAGWEWLDLESVKVHPETYFKSGNLQAVKEWSS